MKKRIIIGSIAFLLTVCLVLFFVNKKKGSTRDESIITYSDQLAKEISFVTNGDVHFDDVIKVVFNNSVIEEDKVNSSPSGVFSFSPNLKGKAIWINRNVLEFQPDKLLPFRTVIDGKLNLQKLSPTFEEKKLEDLVFKLNVMGRDITNFSGTLDLKDRENPVILVYSGVVTLSEKTDFEVIKKEATIKSDTKVELIWSKIDDRNFRFTTSEITRTDKNQEFTITINKKELELETTFNETFVVSPLTKMTANEFRADEAGRNPRIRVTFSDEIDMDQNIDGLLSIEPMVDFEIKKLGKSLIIDGKFKFGSTYKITVQQGIRSRWGTKTAETASQEIKFSDIEPQIEFASDGIILPTSNKKKIQFYTTNLKRVHLQVKKVYTQQIGTFMRSQQLTSSKTRNKDFNDDYSSIVGVIVKNQTIELGNQQNEWLLNEFDLSELFSKYNDGLFLVRVNFTPEDVSIPISSDVLNYIYEKGQIYKPVFLSDIGITVKNANDQTLVFVTDIVTGKPRSSVEVFLLDWDGDVRSSATSNSQGLAVFGDDYFNYVMAKEGEQVTVINKDEMEWSNSGFDIGGVNENRDDLRGFIYTERGVYRPGDSVHICVMVKNAENSFPTDHPVSITVRDPQYNTIFEQTSVKSIDGLYVFGFNTEESAPTGNYNIRIDAGGADFYKDLKIETIVAEQLRVLVKPAKKQIIWTDKSVDFNIDATYLFGAPASDLKTEVSVEVYPVIIEFPKYKDYIFTRQDVDFNSFTQDVLESELDADGKLEGSWVIPSLGAVPSALKLKILAKVLEKSGQPNQGWSMVDMHVYPNYVGIMDPSGYGYFETGNEIRFPVVLLDANGNKLSGKQIQYRIYRNDKNWWYQYDDRRNYQLKYKEDNQTYLESSGNVTIQEGLSYVPFTPSENGEYMVEVYDGGSGHCASIFFSAYRYGSIPGGDLNEGTLSLRSDKEKYNSSETAHIKLPNPRQGNILVTIEKGYKILKWFWVDPANSKGDELIIDIPLNKEMLPNVYVTVSTIQPHDQTVNDRPIRMFGIIPVMLEDPDTRIGFIIESAPNLVPNQDFEIKINTTNNRKAQFTIAVVDEGLLSLTQFRTPHPWKAFYEKIGLFVNTYDIFSHVISANKGDIFQTFSIGGAEEMDYRESQLDPIDGKKRFEPICMFKGPLFTDDRGQATVRFHMPNYNGAVRVMVVGTDEGSFGDEEKTIPVRSEIIMQPGIPRILNPGDEFILPVTIFRMNPEISKAQFTLDTKGPLQIIGNNTADVNFDQNDEANIKFKVKVKEAVGQATITLTGTSGNVSVKSETNIKVVPTSVRIYDMTTEKIAKGLSINMKLPAVGLEGTNQATLNINIFPNMDFEHRLRWLIRYPYGCIEQTTSAMFPQLYLKKMGYFSTEEVTEIDQNINDGIRRLTQFTVSNGGFAYWPGESTESEWGTNYATHFLVEAKKLGYSVPDYLYNNAISRLKNAARQHEGILTTRVNRVFILALAGEQHMAEMNLLMENEFKNMSSTEKWMLATAYHLAGAEDIKAQILLNAGTTTKDYEEFSYNFGSKYRDDAIILYCALLTNQMETAELSAKSIALVLSQREYLSTQSAGYMLLALGKYFDVVGISAAKGKIISGTVTLADGSKIDFNKAGRITMPIRNNFNQNIQISLAGTSDVEQVYASLSYNGVPLKDESKSFAKNLYLKVEWLSKDGSSINPQSLKQGDVIFAKFSVKNTSPLSRVSEIALTQILPSGWQIENVRLNNTALPDWMQDWNLNKEDYLDIRDDRVMWFFDLRENETLDFVVKINCITAGEFWLPGTLLEAMYNKDYKATTEGKKVYVEAFK